MIKLITKTAFPKRSLQNRFDFEMISNNATASVSLSAMKWGRGLGRGGATKNL